ncbi:hypothetical protein MY013_19780 [Escherichia coli]|nr:hypothetical protein MY013_19780 [Escherichia coli]
MSYPTLRLALLSGDWIPLTLPEQMRERLNETMDIISLGGATECAIWSVYYPIGEVESTWTSIPYGRGPAQPASIRAKCATGGMSGRGWKERFALAGWGWHKAT